MSLSQNSPKVTWWNAQPGKERINVFNLPFGSLTSYEEGRPLKLMPLQIAGLAIVEHLAEFCITAKFPKQLFEDRLNILARLPWRSNLVKASAEGIPTTFELLVDELLGPMARANTTIRGRSGKKLWEIFQEQLAQLMGNFELEKTRITPRTLRLQAFFVLLTHVDYLQTSEIDGALRPLAKLRDELFLELTPGKMEEFLEASRELLNSPQFEEWLERAQKGFAIPRVITVAQLRRLHEELEMGELWDANVSDEEQIRLVKNPLG